MEAYRDQYATLFNNGRKVTVIGISVDPDTMLANWAKSSEFPMVFASDAGGKMGTSYGAYDANRKIDLRHLFVVGPDGRIAYHTPSFKVLSPEAYNELGRVVDSLSPPADSTKR
jgi:thioredoxin-dependent peroxiredoxin